MKNTDRITYKYINKKCLDVSQIDAEKVSIYDWARIEDKERAEIIFNKYKPNLSTIFAFLIRGYLFRACKLIKRKLWRAIKGLSEEITKLLKKRSAEKGETIIQVSTKYVSVEKPLNNAIAEVETSKNLAEQLVADEAGSFTVNAVQLVEKEIATNLAEQLAGGDESFTVNVVTKVLEGLAVESAKEAIKESAKEAIKEAVKKVLKEAVDNVSLKKVVADNETVAIESLSLPPASMFQQGLVLEEARIKTPELKRKTYSEAVSPKKKN